MAAVFGPEGADAPAFVRNAVHLHDIRVDAGETETLPTLPDWDTYLYAFEGEATADGIDLDTTESGLFVGDGLRAD